jgi:hypothetical protein
MPLPPYRLPAPAAERQNGDGRARDPVERLQHGRGLGREQQSKEALDSRGELVLVDRTTTLSLAAGLATTGEAARSRTPAFAQSELGASWPRCAGCEPSGLTRFAMNATIVRRRRGFGSTRAGKTF